MSGQILGALVSGPAGDLAGIDGLLITSSVLIVIALLPLGRLRSSEHLVGARLERRRGVGAASRYPSRPMRLSNLFFASLRDDPAEAEMVSHKLLVRAGYVRQLGAGIYTLLPLGFRVQRRIEQVIREEIDAHRRAGDGDARGPPRRAVEGVRALRRRSGPSWSASRTAAGGTWCWP